MVDFPMLIPRSSPEIQEDPAPEPKFPSQTSGMKDRVASTESLSAPRLPTRMERLMKILGLSKLRARDSEVPGDSEVPQESCGGRKAAAGKSGNPRFPKLRAILNFFLGLFTCCTLSSRKAKVVTPPGSRPATPADVINDAMVSGIAADGYYRQTQRDLMTGYAGRRQKLFTGEPGNPRISQYIEACLSIDTILAHHVGHEEQELTPNEVKKLNAAFVRMDKAVLCDDLSEFVPKVRKTKKTPMSTLATDTAERIFIRLRIRLADDEYQENIVAAAQDYNRIDEYGEHKDNISKIIRRYSEDSTEQLTEKEQTQVDRHFSLMDKLAGIQFYDDGTPYRRPT